MLTNPSLHIQIAHQTLFLLTGSFSESKHNPHLFLTARFVLADTDAEPEVTHTYWQGHDDGYVRLFHDAHVPEEHRQEVLLSNGDRYQDTSLWELMYKRISNAKSFIYIAGWSVFVPTRLIRRENEEEIPTLGELLKKKADEGVEVVVMVWDEVMSVKYLMEAGLMGTHDEETHRYFDGTKVNCVKFSRTGDMKKKSILKRIVFSSKQLFSVTHHQKTVVCDAPTRNQAKICAFVGGIDLCDGRYDTADHCLYRRMLSYEYPASDYHNPGDNSFHAKNAPRQPWHDTHSYIEGTAAWHVLQNFRERYNSQSSSKAPRLSNWTDTVGSETLADREKDENWNVQIFRSIDSHVAA
ncbi:hypothetical protein SARC_04224 [Sphaeroforma arctica JP610]|uniref:phospholipase D n=1 Tax=Sphaeroforma arctica JP610 TaxID=667725 RepID=A0A0L0G366_9EUKA|nr:hypothetical protein SARC_04224 [Sphaeroforma arctica JP610]KNC83520.1 hypothetical protein SARC_04224 [Sphaeroforma arctica JP610]|eukprot:XP_014157422.1 hypothetical protein SARC_04224 [Sphaeroforma arctica JP610]